VQLFMLQILYRYSIRGGPFKRGERSIRVTNGVEAEVEAIRELPLELNNDFILRLHNILYVPSLSRNLIYVSCLDDDGFDC
jgi:hypothetical protein